MSQENSSTVFNGVWPYRETVQTFHEIPLTPLLNFLGLDFKNKRHPHPVFFFFLSKEGFKPIRCIPSIWSSECYLLPPDSTLPDSTEPNLASCDHSTPACILFSHICCSARIHNAVSTHLESKLTGLLLP